MPRSSAPRLCMLAATALLSLSVSAEVRSISHESFCSQARDSTSCYELRGVIRNSDLAEMRRAIQQTMQQQPKSFMLVLNSEGGDVMTAMAIGRELRKVFGHAVVLKKCFSACVLVLAGANQRTILSGRVGIHRPYLQEANPFLPFSVVQKQHQMLRAELRKYFDEMNVPSALFDAMQEAPPERIRILSASELQQFGLDREDPVSKDHTDSVLAGTYGLTKQEYLRRLRRVDERCTNWNTYLRCRDAIFSGGNQ